MGRVITVRIINESGVSEPNADATDTEEQEDGKKAPSPASTAEYFKTIAKSLAKNALSTIEGESKYFYGKFLEYENDYRAQMAYQNAMTTISMASSMAKSIVAGGKIGFKKGGATGAVVGVVASAVITTGSQTISVLNRHMEAEEKVLEQSYSNYYYGRRAGLVNGGKGTDN